MFLIPHYHSPEDESHNEDDGGKEVDTGPAKVVDVVVDGSVATLSEDSPVILVAVLDIGVDHHPLGSHSLDVLGPSILKNLIWSRVLMHRFDVVD